MESGLPLPVQLGWRVTRAVFPDELHDDAPATLAALRELRAAATPFPDVPVVGLSADRGFPRRFRAHWTRLRAGLAAAAPQGRHVVVYGTGHNIPRDRPDVVAGTILAVAAQARVGS
jgi:pimeloyl-ACP methyl ester carboxylesterase